MMLIPCIHCGPRNASEFRLLGEASPRPDPATVDPAGWRAYLYLRANPAGWTTERWLHRSGCGRIFVVERHTVTHRIRAARPPGAPERP